MKLLYAGITSLFLGISIIASAQTPAWIWAESAPSNDNYGDVGYGAGTDLQGNIYTTGVFEGQNTVFGNYTLTNLRTGSDAIFIAKYDAAGNVTWAKSPSGNGTSMAIGTDRSGNACITGSYSGTLLFGTDTITTTGNDFFVAKYNAAGNITWVQNSQSTDNSGAPNTGYGVTTDRYNHVFVTGSFETSSVSFGSFTLTNSEANEGDIFLVKYDSSGNILWAKSAGGVANDYGRAVTVDNNDNAIIAGAFNSSSVAFGATILYNSSNGPNFFVTKYDTAGNVLWARGATSGVSAVAIGVTHDGEDNIYVTGSFTSSITIGNVTLTNAGIYDIFLAKFDASGNVLWAKSAGGSSSDYCNSISADNKGGVYIAGNYYSPSLVFGSDTLINNSTQSGENTFVAKYDTAGNVLWAKGAGGTSLDIGLSISADSSNNAYFAGYFSSPEIAFGNDTLNLHATSNADFFIAKLNDCSTPAAPAGLPETICAGNSTTLSASGTGTLSWYSAGTGGSYLGGGDTYSVGNLTSTSTFYVQDSTCTASTRTAITVTVNPKPNPVISLIGRDSLGTAAYSSYLWLFDGNAVEIATQQIYYATIGGNYQVVVTDSNGCSDTSAVFYFQPNGISNIGQSDNLSIYPNPSSGNIILKGVNAGSYLEIYNVLGEKVYHAILKNTQANIDLSNQAAGIYLLYIQSDSGNQTAKMVLSK